MRTKNLLKISMAALAVGLLAGCQTVQPPAQDQNQNQTLTPTGQSTSTVQISNTTGLDQSVSESTTQQKIVKPEDVPQSDRDAFTKADTAKDPALCDGITVDAYKKYCILQSSDKNTPPLQIATEQKCTKTIEKDGHTVCVNYAE